jgi:hypothetical protein
LVIYPKITLTLADTPLSCFRFFVTCFIC